MQNRQCSAVEVCPTKALQWGLGSALQWVGVLLRPWGTAWALLYSVSVCVCPTKALRWGLRGVLQWMWVGVLPWPCGRP